MPPYATIPQDSAFVELSLDGHWIFDADLNLWYANSQGREIASFRPAPDHTLKPEALFSRGADELTQHLRTALNSDGVVDNVIQLNSSSESWMLRIRIRRQTDPTTGDNHLYCTLRDLSGDRVDRLIRDVANSIPIGMVLTNCYGRMFYKNDAFVRMFGYTVEDSHDDRLFNHIIFKDSEDGAHVRDTLLKAGRYEGVHEMRRKTGEIIIVRHRAYVLWKAHKEIAAYCGIYEDITNERAAQKVLKAAKLRAEEGNRAKLDFLAMISHELRTPLNPVLAGAELLTSTDNEAERKELCEMIQQGGHALLNVINEIIDYVNHSGQARKLTIEEVNLHTELDRYYKKALFYAQKKGLEVILNTEECLSRKIRSNADDLWQVMKQLITNAVKFTPKGGTITISAYLENNKEFESRRIRIDVSDTGIGIPENMQEAVFEPFKQVDMSPTRTHGGIGLGLALARDVAHQLGGDLNCTSKPGEGSTFQFVFPCNWELELPPQTPHTLQLAPEEVKLLIIDDDLSSGDTLSLLLKKMGYQATHCTSAKAGIESLTQHPYHLVFMDIQMPQMNGYQATRMIRKGAAGEGAKDIPIIATTAHTLPEDIQRSLECGMNDHLAKPITTERLKAKLNLFLNTTSKG